MTHLLYSISIILFAGILCNEIAKRLHLPAIIGYLIAGILIGPSFLNWINSSILLELETFVSMALAFISFSVGSEFKLKFIKKMGIKPLVITLISSFFTFFIVTGLLVLVNANFSLALILGAIASSTAPPAIMMIIKEYKARGPLTDMMLSVIAIGDVVSILLFGFAFAFAQNETHLTSDLFVWIEPFREIILSLLIGSILGLLLGRCERLIKSDMEMAICIIAFLFLMIGVCEYLNISSLLVAIIMGFAFVNTTPNKVIHKIIHLTDILTPPLFILFFILSGASLDFTLLPEIGLYGIIFIFARTIGKIIGTSMGAKIMKCDRTITKYLGPSLLSQTGIAIGLALVAAEALPKDGQELQAIVVASSVLFDMASPFLVRFCLRRANEIGNEKKQKWFKRA